MEYTDGDYGNEFVMIFIRHGIELVFLESSEFDGVISDEYAIEAIWEMKCEKCQKSALEILDWIVQCRSDEELAEWACEQYSYSRACGSSIACHSPRLTAVQVLLDEYKCGDCRV